ncbi:hypothetical protein P7C73_g5781, partial [Tremellales sp. Uapishka_1]
MEQTKKTVLFVTSPEHGQANSHLAVISALQAKYGDSLDIHVSSFELLRKRVPGKVTFDPLVGKGLVEYYNVTGTSAADAPPLTLHDVTTRPGLLGAVVAAQKILQIIHPESPEEYLAAAQSVEALIDALDPDLIVVDTLFSAARDAIVRKGREHVLLSPNTLKENTEADQGAGVFFLPYTGIGYPYPLPWYLVIPNAIMYLFTAIWIFFLDPRYKALCRIRHANGYPDKMPLFDKRSATVLCMSTPALEFPGIIPPDVICCGPFLQASQPEPEGEIFHWTAQAPTVLVALGSHWRMDAEAAHDMLVALRVLMEKRKDRWRSRGLRIVQWLDVDPIALLRTGHVVCVVNHGGSNSYHEALATGTPQVILSPWFDCHDFGIRAEWLGIGKWGNKHTAPKISQKEVSKALLTVVGATPGSCEAGEIYRKAKKAAEIVKEYQGGRGGSEVAADYIWDLVKKSK